MDSLNSGSSGKRKRTDDFSENQPNKRPAISSDQEKHVDDLVGQHVNTLISAFDHLRSNNDASQEADWDKLAKTAVRLKTIINKIRTPGDRSEAQKVVRDNVAPIVNAVLDRVEAEFRSKNIHHRDWKSVTKDLRLAGRVEYLISDLMDANFNKTIDERMGLCMSEVASGAKILIDYPDKQDIGLTCLQTLRELDPSSIDLASHLAEAHIKIGNTVLGNALKDLAIVAKDLTRPESERSAAYEVFQHLAVQTSAPHDRLLQSSSLLPLQTALEMGWDKCVALALIQQGANLKQGSEDAKIFTTIFGNYGHDDAMQLISEGLGIKLPEEGLEPLIWAIDNQQGDLALAMMDQDVVRFAPTLELDLSISSFLHSVFELRDADLIRQVVDKYIEIKGLDTIPISFIESILKEGTDSERLKVAADLINRFLDEGSDKYHRRMDKILDHACGSHVNMNTIQSLVFLGTPANRILDYAITFDERDLALAATELGCETTPDLIRKLIHKDWTNVAVKAIKQGLKVQENQWDHYIRIFELSCRRNNEEVSSALIQALLEFALVAEKWDFALTLIGKGANIDFETSPAMILFDLAVDRYDKKLINSLLSRGAKPSDRLKPSWSKLLRYIDDGLPNLVVAFIEKGTIPTDHSYSVERLFMKAVSEKELPICRALIKYTDSFESQRAELRGEAVVAAARADLPSVVLALFEHKVALKDAETEGFRLLEYAITNGLEKVAFKLLKDTTSLDSKTKSGDTLFDLALRAGLTSVAQAIAETTGVSAPMTVDQEVEPEAKDFDAGTTKFLLNYFNGKKENSYRPESPLQIGNLLAYPSKMIRLNASGEKKELTEIHIQHASEPPENKRLILQINQDGLVERFYLNGKEMPAEDLLDHNHPAGKLFSKLLDGFAISAIRVSEDGRELSIHQQTLRRIPEPVLPFIRTGQTYQFYNDDLTKQAGIDAGGPKRKFFGEFALSFFSGNPGRATQIKSGMILSNLRDEAEPERLQQVGEKLFYRAYSDKSLALGRVLDDQFFALVSLFLNSDNPSRDKILIAIKGFLEGDLASSLNKDLIDAYLMEIPQLSDKVCQDLEEIMFYDAEDIPNNGSPKEIRDFIEDALLEGIHAQQAVQAARHVADGMLKGAQAKGNPVRELANLRGTAPAKLSEAIQGQPLNREEIIKRIKCDSKNPVVLQKREWLKNYIRRSPDEEVKEFIETVTGSPTITAQTDFNIHEAQPDREGRPVNNCSAQTCSNRLNVPGHHTDVGTDVQPDINPTNEEKFINSLRLLYSEKGFDMA